MGVSTAVLTARPDAAQPLAAAGLDGLVTAVVDGEEIGQAGLAALPDPAAALHAAARLGTHPTRTGIVHAEPAGVQAACRGGFGLVVGVDRRGGQETALCAFGAETVLTGVDALTLDEDAAQRRWWQVPQRGGPGAMHAGWLLDYHGFEPDTEGIRETLCALGNGYLVTRGAAPECPAGPVHYPGTYAAGVFNRLRSRVDGHLHEDESLVNLPDWQVLRWRPERDRWVTPERPGVSEYRQTLDLRAGVLYRRYRYVDRRGRATTVVTRRFASMAEPHVVAMQTTFVPENWSGVLHVHTAIDGRVTNTQVEQYAPFAHRHLRPDGEGHDPATGLWLRARTTQSDVGIGVATRTEVFTPGAPTDVRRRVTIARGRPQETYAIAVREGQPVRVHKTAAYHTARDRAISEPASAARQAVARAAPFTELLAAHVDAWRRLWERSHLELHTDGPAPVLALNLHTFHLVAATSPNVVDLDAGVGARGLHGEGYRGKIFWDELFVHRVLALHLPEASRALLLYRWRRLDAARQAAAAIGRRGAMFPWESGSDGREETPPEVFVPELRRWVPNHSAYQRHVGLAIGYSVWQYYQATGDVDFLRTYGAELMLEIARFFADLAFENPRTGRYEITGVMGPDEFHDSYPGSDEPGLSNNAYTNVMTVWLLRHALEVVDLLAHHYAARVTDRLGIGEHELARWARITTRMYVPFHDDRVISQFDGYDRLAPFDLEGYAARHGDISRLDVMLAARGDSPDRYQISKQADVLMLLYLLSAEELRELLGDLGYDWPAPALLRTVDYYVHRVSHGSTLSRVVHAWVQARTDRVASWECFTQALAVDIGHAPGTVTREGVHLGAMAGTLDLVERCYMGIETRDDALWLNPRLPEEVATLHTLITYRGQQLHVTATQSDMTLVAAPCDVPPLTVHPAGHAPASICGGQTLTFPLKRPAEETAR